MFKNPKFVSASLVLGAVVVGFALAGMQNKVGDQTGVDESLVVDNPWVCEPLIVFDCSGSTLTGEDHLHLAVYDNGLVSFAQCSIGARIERVESRILPARDGENLLEQLMDAGGFELLDQKHFATDLPMTSVTLFQGETNALAHTFNYWTPTGPYQAIQGIIEEFIAQVFP